MTERTIRNMAKEFAAAWYEQNSRTERFRKGEDKVNAYTVVETPQGPQQAIVKVPFRVAFPDAKSYANAAWPHWVTFARQKMAEMLKPDSTTSERLKHCIADALIEENEKARKHGSKPLLQGRFFDR
jgi:hypothetical protein